MKFLLGALLGGAATVLVATAVGGPTQALFDRGQAALERSSDVWDSWWRAAGKRVFPAPERLPEPAVAVAFEPQTPASEPEHLLDLEPEPAEVFALASSSTDADAAVDAPAMQPLPENPSPARVATHAELTPIPAAGSAKESVWVPFRSQMSAQGFAAALTAQTQHPFEVERQGPGRYQVLFTYADTQQRDALLQQVRSLTGSTR